MSITEALIGVFSDDPINWLKWGIVFAILIGGYIIAIPLYGKVSSRLSWERKRDIAKYDWSATYHYELQGEEREYHAYFKEPTRPPVYLYLYYLDNPRKLFSVEEYHYENHKAILLLPVIFLPWILALAAMFLLNIPLPTR